MRADVLLVILLIAYAIVALLSLPSIVDDATPRLDAAHIVEWHRNGRAGQAPETLLFLFADNSYLSYIQNYICSLQRAVTTRDFGVVLVTWEPVLVDNVVAWLDKQPVGFQIGSLKLEAWSELGMDLADAADNKIRPVGSPRYKKLIKRKIPMIRMLLDHFSTFIFSDADIAWRDDALLELLPRASQCDMLFMSDSRDKLSLCQILAKASPASSREPNVVLRDSEGRAIVHDTLSCRDRSAWQTYPSETVYKATMHHDVTHPTDEDRAVNRRGGKQDYAKLNMGFLFARSNKRTKDLLDRFIEADRIYDYTEEQDAVYHVLAGDPNAPEHRFVDPMDETAAALPEHVKRLCILPPEQYPNGFLATRYPWSLDYAKAFGRDFGEGIPMNATCPCNMGGQYTAIYAMREEHHTNSLIHFNGLSPSQKIPATMWTGLWFLQQDDVCSVDPVVWDEDVFKWGEGDIVPKLRKLVRGDYGVDQS